MQNKNFDIFAFLESRPLSWSALSSFEYDKEQWYRNYILGERDQSKEMDFGSYVDKRIQNDPDFIPKLPRYPEMQYKMRAVFNRIPLVGIPDGLCLTNKLLADYKTGKKAWDKKRADETGQLTFYLFLLYIIKKEKPEDYKLLIHWLPTCELGDFSIALKDENDVRTFETKRSMKHLLEFGARINKTVLEMQDYVRNHN